MPDLEPSVVLPSDTVAAIDRLSQRPPTEFAEESKQPLVEQIARDLAKCQDMKEELWPYLRMDARFAIWNISKWLKEKGFPNEASAILESEADND